MANLTVAGRFLAVVAVVLAFGAVVLALIAQILGVYRDFNRYNLVEVEEWYQKRFAHRAPCIRWATILLVAATAFAAAAAVVTLVGGSEAPTLAVTRTSVPAPGKVIVDVTFRGLDDGAVPSAVVRVDGIVAAEAAFGPGADGTATRTVAVEQVPANGVVMVEAHAGGAVCTAILKPGVAAEVRCPGG